MIEEFRKGENSRNGSGPAVTSVCMCVCVHQQWLVHAEVVNESFAAFTVGQKTISQPPIVRVVPLKKRRGNHRNTSTVRDRR